MDLIITILPVVTKDLPISPRFTPYIFFIAMQVQHSYNSSTNGLILLTHVPTLSVTKERSQNPTLVRIELTTSGLADVQLTY